ncbi:DNA-binding transcriptional regulator, LysR family [Paracidovorax cattleyae]|uniref:DNA-binding transcriptional regulator, LysR family n=3 Tax=Paracidovorax cattleyae TaxID=80868 RepID=A0A1H0R2H5_9BURK|nr:LysR family transcriptional regulator [Paracidovorax cattleyae]AVS74782.1 LysR family transcriptional regulator [Paracidovorax cattleyae]MBF9264203.1 LysR family transcriptional regulator [Paracidovorax cattleyae]SDP23687.1 DNA-binding transcriptional regulator, LysR family [Paracidovorax cattleyae]
MDRLRAMDAFVRSADLGTLSAAARSLSTTQPTVSKLIASLEASLGVRLLERGPARVVLTEEGLRFLERARQLLDDYEEAVADLDERTRQPRGLVRISAPVALGELKLSPLMLLAMQQYPELQVDLMLDDRFVDPVEERFDITVRIGGTLPPDLVARELAHWPRYIVASPEYVKRHGRPRALDELARHCFLRYPLWADDSVTLFGPDGAVNLPIHSRYRINHAVALLNAVRDGAGVAFQPCWMVNDLIQRKQLVRLLPQWTGPAQNAYMVYPRRSRQPMRVQVMMELLAREIQSL